MAKVRVRIVAGRKQHSIKILDEKVAKKRDDVEILGPADEKPKPEGDQADGDRSARITAALEEGDYDKMCELLGELTGEKVGRPKKPEVVDALKALLEE